MDSKSSSQQNKSKMLTLHPSIKGLDIEKLQDCKCGSGRKEAFLCQSKSCKFYDKSYCSDLKCKNNHKDHAPIQYNKCIEKEKKEWEDLKKKLDTLFNQVMYPLENKKEAIEKLDT
jgi:hypothetical protein